MGDETNSQTQVSISSWATYSVQVGFWSLWEVEINDGIYSLNIDASSEKI